MAEGSSDALDIIRSHLLAGVPHGFLGRSGGVSTGEFVSLNTGPGSGDDPVAVAENRRRAADSVMTKADLVGVYQIHSPDCVTVAEPWTDAGRPHADALVTNRPGILLGIVTADCAPILFADREAGVVGAAHAGWRGALAGVSDRTIEAMEALGARRSEIAAAIGPCIAQASYEVDGGFRDRFEEADSASARFFAEGRPGHWQFDLTAYVIQRLEAAGLTSVEPLGLDTYADRQRFFSFRRATHLGEAAYGRQISLIGLNKPG